LFRTTTNLCMSWFSLVKSGGSFSWPGKRRFLNCAKLYTMLRIVVTNAKRLWQEGYDTKGNVVRNVSFIPKLMSEVFPSGSIAGVSFMRNLCKEKRTWQLELQQCVELFRTNQGSLRGCTSTWCVAAMKSVVTASNSFCELKIHQMY
jgi:hypothetical protein